MRALPSTDLYFANACAPAMASLWRRGAIRRVGASSFHCGAWRVLVRRDSPRAMAEALAWPGRLAYVVDDDIAAAANCEALPPAYRARLADFAARWHQPLLARADVVLAASDAVAEACGGGAIPRRIEPAWREPFADQRHFAPLAQGGSLHVAHLGSGSHGAALAALAPAMARWLERESALTFTYVAPRAVHAGLEAHPRARRLEPRPWPEYRRWLARQRFHLALYPLLETRFERARSASKLSEHAITGALGVYPEGWAPARRLGAGALWAPDGPEGWARVLAAAGQARAGLAARAGQAAQALRAADALGQQRALWSDLLGVALP